MEEIIIFVTALLRTKQSRVTKTFQMKKYFLFSFSVLSLVVFAGEDGNKKPAPLSPIATMLEDGNALLKKGQFSAAMAPRFVYVRIATTR